MAASRSSIVLVEIDAGARASLKVRLGVTLALTPVVLKEIAYFGPAIIAALVAGDIVANEDGGGTLKTILVRSVRRGEILTAKALALFTYVVVALLVFVVTGIVAGTIAWGFHPLANISGRRLPRLPIVR